MTTIQNNACQNHKIDNNCTKLQTIQSIRKVNRQWPDKILLMLDFI